MLLQNHKCIFQKEFECVKKRRTFHFQFSFVYQASVPRSYAQYTHSCICGACFQCMFCVPNFFGTQGLVYGSEGGMEYFVRAHPHISFYNPVAAKVGQVTFDQSTPDSKLTLQLCCYGQTRNYLLTKNNQVTSLSRK